MVCPVLLHPGPASALQPALGGQPAPGPAGGDGLGGVRTGLLVTAGELHAQRAGTVGGQVWMPGVLSAAMACCSCSLSPNFSTTEWNVLRELLCLSK